jgi:hypothetical protein
VDEQQVVGVAGVQGGVAAEPLALPLPGLRPEEQDVLRAVDGPVREPADADDLDVAGQVPVDHIRAEAGQDHDHGQERAAAEGGLPQAAVPAPVDGLGLVVRIAMPTAAASCRLMTHPRSRHVRLRRRYPRRAARRPTEWRYFAGAMLSPDQRIIP